MLTHLRRKLTPYYVDILNREYSSGWCFHRLFTEKKMTVSFRVNGRVVGETKCNLLREDLQEQNLHPDGFAGFECLFDEPLSVNPGQELNMYINSNPVAMERFPSSQVLNVFKPDDNPVFFMHIPKTAGTSFNNYIRQYFGYGMAHTHIQTTPLERQQEMARTSHFLSGHITLEHIPTIFLGNDHVHYHTIVRQPLKQFHSHVGWVKGIALNQKSDFFKKHDHTVQDMGVSLFQTDLGDPENLALLVENLDGFQIDFFDNIQTRYFLDYRPDRVTQADCDAAINNITRFKTIGLTENFNDYVGRFCDFYSIQEKPVTSVHNPSKVKPLFDVNDQEIRTVIDPLVKFDLQLYQAIVDSNKQRI